MRKNLPVGTVGYDASSGQYTIVTSSSSSSVPVIITGPVIPMDYGKPKNNRERYLEMISEGRL